VNTLDDEAQDQFIAEVLKSCARDLEIFTRGARPMSEFVASVTGPHDDPIQGMIHAHTIAAKFDLDTLDPASDAYRVHVLEADGVTEGNRLEGGLARD
jgi:PIN domain nuclease of toxin-antitoxin system